MTPILFAVALAGAPLPVVLAQTSGSVPVGSAPGVTPCNPTQEAHSYANPETMGDSRDAQADAYGGLAIAFDGCNANVAADYNLDCQTSSNACYTGLVHGDGDPETGDGGGKFPAYLPCLPPGARAHHSHDPSWWFGGVLQAGVPYSITSVVPLVPAALIVGTDGPIDPSGNPCLGDGIIHDDPVSEPYDCGAGIIGFSDPPLGAFIVANDPAAFDLNCAPASGYVDAFVLNGPIFFDNSHCQLPSVDARLGDDLAGNPTAPAVDPGDQGGCTTVSLQTVAVSVEGFIADRFF